MAKVLAKKKDKAAKHIKSVEIVRAVVAERTEDFKLIAAGLNYTEEDISEALKFVSKLKVSKA